MAPMNEFSPAQRRQLALAPASRKPALRAQYNEQNAGKVPGKSRDQKVARMTALRNMPAPGNNHGWKMKGGQPIMPDMTKGNWDQTPAASGYLAPRGFGYYDAFAHDPYTAGTHMSIGPATPIVGSTIAANRIQTQPSTTLLGGGVGAGLEGGSFIVIVYPSTGPTQARGFACSSDQADETCYFQNYNSPQLVDESPLDAIPTRCSVRIRNTTQSVAQGGLVRVLRMTTGVGILGVSGGGASVNPGYTSNGSLAAFMEGVRNHARTVTYTGDQLSEAMQKNCTVVDQSRALWFEDWNTETPAAQIPWAKAQGYPDEQPVSTYAQQLYQPSYTPIVFLFEPFIAQYGAQGVTGGLGNYYELTIRSQFLSHYPQGTMLANLAITPKANPTDMTKHRNAEEHKQSVLEKLGHLAGSGVQWGWKHREQIARVARPVVERILLTGG